MYPTRIRALLGALALLIAAPIVAMDAFEPQHKVVIQVSTDDARTQTIALNNAVNLQQHYGMDNVAVEIVAYGPGLSLLVGGSKNSQRVESLAKQSIIFSACGNTKKKIEQTDGKPLVLSQGVQVVPAGVARIVELQQDGYQYVRP